MGNFTTIQKSALALMVLALAAIPVWLLGVLPGLEQIPADFSFKADINSSGRVFDPEKNEFKGEQFSKVNLNTTVISVQGDRLVLNSVFDARTPTGQPIYTIKRQYEADANTGRSLAGNGKSEVWIILPKPMEKQAYRTPYFVRVDPVVFEFVGEEELLGLPVYRYHGSDSVDASKVFSFEQGVPEQRGVTNSVEVEMWVEPVSGRIVNLIDTGENTYFDPNTKKPLFPRNKYSNVFTDDAIANQVRLAQNEKQTIRLYEIIIPVLFGGVALVMLVAVLLAGRLERPRE